MLSDQAAQRLIEVAANTIKLAPDSFREVLDEMPAPIYATRTDGTIVLADEVLTPDSSRFWPVDQYEPGHAQPSFDKQFVRNWLVSPESGWDRKSDTPPPELPPHIVEQTRERYVEAYELLTGETF